jgi:hypothetical protein
MPKVKVAFAAALSVLLLPSCGSPEPTSGQNNAVEAEANVLENSSASDPAQPGPSTNGLGDPVPPPDAVSHPNGYLPPAPGEPGPTNVNSSGSDESPPATEDEYIRNQSRR